jgi:TPR repeat protein
LLAGNTEAMYNLAAIYINGEGVTADRELGIKWLRKAARAGYEKRHRLHWLG